MHWSVMALLGVVGVAFVGVVTPVVMVIYQLVQGLCQVIVFVLPVAVSTLLSCLWLAGWVSRLGPVSRLGRGLRPILRICFYT
jgi:hypothetical protein